MTIEREISLPFTPTAPSGTPRHAGHDERATPQLRIAGLLEQQADEIAARWEGEAAALLPDQWAATTDGAPGAARGAPAVQPAVLVRALVTSLADDGGSTHDIEALGFSFGTSWFEAGAKAQQLLLALNRLETLCLEVIEGALENREMSVGHGADAVRLCQRLRHVAGMVAVAATAGHAEAMNRALQERFRRLRHDLRNPISTIRSALSLMADETVPEEARRSPRFRAMIERNTATLDQLVVSRLSDAAAQNMSAPSAPGGSDSARIVVDEAGDDVARSRQRDD